MSAENTQTATNYSYVSKCSNFARIFERLTSIGKELLFYINIEEEKYFKRK